MRPNPNMDFSIDPEYELAKLINSVNVSLTDNTSFCVKTEALQHPCAFIHKSHLLCVSISTKFLQFFSGWLWVLFPYLFTARLFST